MSEGVPLKSLREAYSGKRVLLTGGTGYIGSGLLRSLQDLGCEITLLVREDAPVDQRVTFGGAHVRLLAENISARNTWAVGLEGAEFVFHLAAQTSAYRARADPLGDLNINVVPVLHMLEACSAQNSSARIVFAGTVTQVGLTERVPVSDTQPDRPITIYDIHKLAVEGYLRVFAEQGPVKTATLRLANVYGPGPATKEADRGVLNQMIRKAMRREPLTVYGAGDGVRDYVFIDDVVSAFLFAGAWIGALNGGSYVIGSGVGTRLVDAAHLVVDRVERLTGFRAPVRHVPPPDRQLSIERRSFVADTTRFCSSTGWAPHVALAEGIDRTIGYFVREATQSTKESQTKP